MQISDHIQQAIVPGVTTQTITKLMRAEGRTSLTADGLRKCLAGVTSLDELRRVAFEY
jgi:type II secretory ATPase GspE/PulE/Tfp pilus assembly ATPase PilB-like protein